VDRDWHTITCVIHCPSGVILREVEEAAAKEVDPAHIVTRTLHFFSAEAEMESYRLADYFESVELLPDEPNNKLRLTFHTRQGVDSHWKFLIATVLRSIGNRFAGVSVEFPRQST